MFTLLTGLEPPILCWGFFFIKLYYYNKFIGFTIGVIKQRVNKFMGMTLYFWEKVHCSPQQWVKREDQSKTSRMVPPWNPRPILSAHRYAVVYTGLPSNDL
uniref:Uncharacterized protein n=1 Tax=Cacopsylla melanoneura TaxID=428564 RepID=A0A8D9BU22_9HEMI